MLTKRCFNIQNRPQRTEIDDNRWNSFYDCLNLCQTYFVYPSFLRAFCTLNYLHTYKEAFKALAIQIINIFNDNFPVFGQQCLNCDSAVDGDESCSYNAITNPKTEQCDNTALGCFTEIYQSQNDDYSGYYTRRGCLLDTKVCKEGECVSCSTFQNCNNKVFPTNRPKCLKCTGGECLTTKSEYCRVYLRDNNECVTLFDDGELFKEYGI